MSSGSTAQDPSWKSKEQSEEARYAHQKEQEQLAALREKLDKKDGQEPQQNDSAALQMDKDFEGGLGGQEDLEDRYATTSGEH